MQHILWICMAVWATVVLANTEPMELQDSTETADRAPPAAEPTPSPAVWSHGVAVIGRVEVDPGKREVRVPGWVNMTEGAIELLACGRGGKTHESAFVLDVNPLDLQAGLLLLGLQPGKPPTGLGEGMPSGTEVDLMVEWEENGCRRAAPAGVFVYNYGTKSVMSNVTWVFTGSVIEDGMFKALAEESLVVTYWDPWAIVNVGHPMGSNDAVWAINHAAIPPLNTPITMRFIPRNQREASEHGRAGQRVHRED